MYSQENSDKYDNKIAQYANRTFQSQTNTVMSTTEAMTMSLMTMTMYKAMPKTMKVETTRWIINSVMPTAGMPSVARKINNDFNNFNDNWNVKHGHA